MLNAIMVSETYLDMIYLKTCKLSKRNSKTKLHKMYSTEGRVQFAIINKLRIKNQSYLVRLENAIELSKNHNFLNALKKFSSMDSLFYMKRFYELNKRKLKHARFTTTDKFMALNFYRDNPRAYRLLQKIFLLPSARSLSRLIAQTNLKSSLNERIFNQLNKYVDLMDTNDELCTLLFGEVSLGQHFQYDPINDLISSITKNGKSRQNKLSNRVLIFMIRGIQKKYKQPVAFCPCSTDKYDLAIMLKEIIKRLYAIGFNVLATICHQRAINIQAINVLIEETRLKYYKSNKLKRYTFEIGSREVIPLYDPPHLLKGIRNHFLKQNLVCSINGTPKVAKWEHIIKLYEEFISGLFSPIEKLTEKHTNPNKSDLKKVRYAAGVFSQQVGAFMGFLAKKNLLPLECTQTADVILFLDQLFDSVNGCYENSKESDKMLLKAVTHKSSHKNVWAKSKIILRSMKFINKCNKHEVVPTVINWLRTINNIEYLIEVLQIEFHVQKVWMRRFNLDPLENYFAAIQSYSSSNDGTITSFESCYSALLRGRSIDGEWLESNCEDDRTKVLFHSLE